jgi:glycosyltransferase involved in cell wall biosynthesis
MSKSSLSINFVLPGATNFPGGGPKVVYEYANALVHRGHRVTVVHPAIGSTEMSALQFGKAVIRYLQRAVDKSYRPDAWFRVDPRVRLLWKPTLDAYHVPDADVTVATWWRTAERVAEYPQSKGRKFYLLQSLETFGGPKDRVMATWKLPLHKIVIARWLHRIAESMGEGATYIPNGLDFMVFGVDIDPGSRDPNRAMMLYHRAEWKGSADGLKALQFAKEGIPKLTAELFGAFPPPHELPPWVRYHQNPPQAMIRHLYNEAAVFMSPSWIEGWGLPPAEAMACGCAVVATDIDGHSEYCSDDVTALLSPPKDPRAMADNLVRLSRNHRQRVQLACAGNQYIQQFTWDRAVNAFETILLGKDQVGKEYLATKC